VNMWDETIAEIVDELPHRDPPAPAAECTACGDHASFSRSGTYAGRDFCESCADLIGFEGVRRLRPDSATSDGSDFRRWVDALHFAMSNKDVLAAKDAEANAAAAVKATERGSYTHEEAVARIDAQDIGSNPTTSLPAIGSLLTHSPASTLTKHGLWRLRSRAWTIPPHKKTLNFPNILAHHEAGHALVSYALGHGLAKLWIRVTRKAEGGWRSDGMSTRPRATIRKMPTPKRIPKPLSVRHQRLLVAGVAAERKFCLLWGTPMRTLGGSEASAADASARVHSAAQLGPRA